MKYLSVKTKLLKCLILIHFMQQIIKLLIGFCFLILGIPIGNILAKYTKEELKDGKRWFKLIILTGLIGGLIGAIIGNDALMFSLFFIVIITSRSIKK